MYRAHEAETRARGSCAPYTCPWAKILRVTQPGEASSSGIVRGTALEARRNRVK